MILFTSEIIFNISLLIHALLSETMKLKEIKQMYQTALRFYVAFKKKLITTIIVSIRTITPYPIFTF